MKILCKIFGHKMTGLDTKRLFARCSRCYKHLKVTYDVTYGETVVVGDYGSQTTFCWCECGNELISTNSHQKCNDNGFECYKCSNCGEESKWDFDAPVPLLIKD